MKNDLQANYSGHDAWGKTVSERHLGTLRDTNQLFRLGSTPRGNRSPGRGVLGMLLLLLCFVSPALRAQSAASINGTVKDTTGAALSGASVLLTNSDTGVK